MKNNQDFWDRIIELVKEDQELHDATIKLILAIAEEKTANAARIVKKTTGR